MDKQGIKHWTFVLILSYMPTIGFHLLVRPMWYKDVDSFTSATSIETLFTIIFLPIYLLFTNYFLAKKYRMTTEVFIINGLIILSCIYISTQMHFKNWADSIGSYDNPDIETVAVMDFERTTGMIISIIGIIIILFQLHNKNQTQTETKTNNSTT